MNTCKNEEHNEKTIQIEMVWVGQPKLNRILKKKYIIHIMEIKKYTIGAMILSEKQLQHKRQ